MISINTYITKQTIERFSVKIGYNVSTYMDLYSFFIQNNKHKITDYFQNQDVKPDADSFDYLEKMLKEAIRIDNLIKLHKENMNSIDDWDLLDYIENIRTSLESINNSSRYLRSSKTSNSWRTTNPTYDYVMAQNETVEDIVGKQLYSQNEDADWVDFLIKSHNLSEPSTKISR